jgi:elongation factor Tu
MKKTKLILTSLIMAAAVSMTFMGCDPNPAQPNPTSDPDPDPTPVKKAEDDVFFLPVEDVFSITDSETNITRTIITGKIKTGKVKLGDKVQLIGMGNVYETEVAGIEMFRKQISEAEAGDNVGIQLKDESITKSDVKRGMALITPDSRKQHKKFTGEIYIKTKDEGGRSNPISSGFRPQIYFETTDITGELTFEGEINPGDKATVTIELVTPMPIKEGDEFIIREGGRNVTTVSTIKEILD